MLDKKKLALIHIVKGELHLSDEQYRAILYKVAGVRTAKELQEPTFRKLMRYFVRSEHYRINAYGVTMRQKLYIQSIAQMLHWSTEHLNNFIHKYYHKPDIQALTKTEATKLIQSLKHVVEHHEKSGPAPSSVSSQGG
jgi:hypothetical protein